MATWRLSSAARARRFVPGLGTAASGPGPRAGAPVGAEQARRPRVTAEYGSVWPGPSQQDVVEKYEAYRDSVDGLPSCQRELQLYQKKVQDLADNRDKLAALLKEVSVAAVRPRLPPPPPVTVP